jgi:hypothetical protein
MDQGLVRAAGPRTAIARYGAGLVGVIRWIHSWIAARLDHLRKLRMFERFAAEILACGVLTADGLEDLLAKQRDLGLDNGKLAWVPERMVSFAVRESRRTNRQSPEQLRTLELIAETFGASQRRIGKIRDSLQQARLLYEIDRGHLPVVNVAGLLLQRDEVVHWAEFGSILEVRVVARHYQGGSHGVSFRIAKGVTYRVGASRGRMVSERRAVPVSHGVLALTNQRIIFNGDAKSLAAKWGKVLSLNHLSDGIQISMENKAQPTVIRYDSSRNAEVVAAVASRLTSERG